MSRYLQILRETEASRLEHWQEDVLKEVAEAINTFVGKVRWAVVTRGLLLSEGQEYRLSCDVPLIDLVAAGEVTGASYDGGERWMCYSRAQLREALESFLRNPTLIAQLEAIRKP